MRPTVYLDTTIPSYYVDEREALRVHIERTRAWWNEEARQYEVFTSPLVIRELEEGEFPGRTSALELLRDVPLLSPVPRIAEIVEEYLANHLMPRRDGRDAFHLAFASHYKMDYLLTWNCAHLANVNKRKHIAQVNQRLGLFVPVLITPLELVPDSAEEDL